MFSLSIFTIGSLIASFSFNATELIMARIIQGLGGAGMDAAGIAILADTFRSVNRGRAFGINQMTVYIGLTTGPVLGGLLVQSLGWRSIFYVNIPVGIAAILLTFVFIKKDSFDRTSTTRFDFFGSFTLTSFLTLLLLSLNDGSFQLSAIETGLLYLGCLASFFSFIYIETKVSSPLLDLALFTHNRLFVGGAATALMNYLTVYGTILVVSLFLQTVRGFSPFSTGLVIIAQTVCMVITSPIAGVLSDRVSARYLSSFGMGLKSVAFFILSFLGPKSSVEAIVIPLVLIGIGHGFFSSPNLNSVMSSVIPEKFGAASGMMGTIRQSAQSIGIAIMGGLIASRLPVGSLYSSSSLLPASLVSDFVSGMSLAFLVACCFSAIGVLTSLMRGKNVDQKNL